MTKESLREEIGIARRGLDPAWVRARSAVVANRVIGMPEFERAGTVFCYLSLPREVATDAIVAACHAGGKQVCVPAFDEGASGYAPAGLGRQDGLRAGHLGVMEPVDVRWIDGEKIDLAVVPGVAFDAAGRRLGHGGGYYDRILDRLGRGGGGALFRVGLAFEFQVFESIPAAEHDVCMDAVVTGKRVLRRAGGERDKR